MGRTIRILGTGGTIAGVAAPGADDSRYDAGELAVRDLIRPLMPSLSAWVDEVETEDVAQIDSSNMSHAVWAALARAAQRALDDPAVVGIVITHGTDTLEETAIFLQGVLRPHKPIVMTAAMRPATSVQADGPRNLTQAVRLACRPGLAGLWMAFAGKAWPAVQVRKLHPFALEAFGGGDGPPVWVWRDSDWSATGTGSPEFPQASPRWAQSVSALLSRPVEDWPRVALLQSHAGADGEIVSAVLALGAQGLVIAATGNGSVHVEIDRALHRAVEQGRVAPAAIRVASRCIGGWVEGEPAHGWPTVARLTPAQARVALMLELAGLRPD